MASLHGKLIFINQFVFQGVSVMTGGSGGAGGGVVVGSPWAVSSSDLSGGGSGNSHTTAARWNNRGPQGGNS